MIDINAIQSVSRVMQRVNEIETKVGMRKLVRAPKVSTDNTGAAKTDNQPGFDQVLSREIKKAEAKDKLPHQTLQHSTALADEIADAVAQAKKEPRTGREYSSVIKAAATKYGVDPRLVSAVAEAESDFDQNCISSAGAVGVMQLMPETAAMLGVNPYNAEENIEGGTKYLSQMLKTFGGDVRRAVAAYNAGPQAVKDYGGVPPYSETQAYVNTVLDLYR